jgi:hypothetical protein
MLMGMDCVVQNFTRNMVKITIYFYLLTYPPIVDDSLTAIRLGTARLPCNLASRLLAVISVITG